MTQDTKDGSTRESEDRSGEVPRAIVGIGASAGGLEAFEQFFTHMPADTGMAFVLVSHMDPSHKGILPELLRRFTAMPVVEAEDGMSVRPDTVYVRPANADLSLLNGTITLLEITDGQQLRMPIDYFLRSLAEDQPDGRAVGIILSGTGTDGTLGVRALKEHSGTVLVQEPSTARFAGMPQSAIATELADYIAPAEELPGLLAEYARHSTLIAGTARDTGTQFEAALNRIFVLIRSKTGQDFSLYKRSTVQRRIERRMGLHRLGRIADYVRYLSENPQEIEILAKEMRIGVTRFFRDSEAWEALRVEVGRSLIPGRRGGGALRVWVPGCSTGEEAYSMAIILRECLDEMEAGTRLTLQIFATDLDDDAIEIARVGRYPANITADVSEERLARFFVKEDETYRIRQEIREAVVFARQNLIADPPFTHLDILSCRNLLIYLSTDLQKKIIPLFHYALRPGGILFLGTAETTGTHPGLFKPLDGRWKIFERREAPTPQIDLYSLPALFTPEERGGVKEPAAPRGASVADRAHEWLNERYVPPAIIVNENGDILHFQGRTGKYLEHASGKANINVYSMAREGLRYPLTTALRTAGREETEVTTNDVSVKTESGYARITLIVRPMRQHTGSEQFFLVVFEESSQVPPLAGPEVRGGEAEGGEDTRAAGLERELAATRSQLQSTLEDAQSSQEEMKAMNEELQSTNEELQSTNEELTTSKEELQSLNEELLTVNTELQAKIDELSMTNDDMRNILRSTDIAMLFLDSDLRVRRFTEPAREIVNLIATDVGRPVTDLVVTLRDEPFVDDARRVLKTLVPVEKSVRAEDGRWYQMRILPYRTAEDRIDGVVVTFVDITTVKNLEQSLSEARNYAENIIATVREPLIVLDADLRVVSANQSFYKTFRVAPGETEGDLLYALGNAQWDIPDLRRLLEEILPKNAEFDGFEMEHDFPQIGHKVMRLNARRIASETGPDLILLAIEDVTEQVRAKGGESPAETATE
jgi:two-component system CheB/CheR fusion protein